MDPSVKSVGQHCFVQWFSYLQATPSDVPRSYMYNIAWKEAFPYLYFLNIFYSTYIFYISPSPKAEESQPGTEKTQQNTCGDAVYCL